MRIRQTPRRPRAPRIGPRAKAPGGGPIVYDAAGRAFAGRAAASASTFHRAGVQARCGEGRAGFRRRRRPWAASRACSSVPEPASPCRGAVALGAGCRSSLGLARDSLRVVRPILHLYQPSRRHRDHALAQGGFLGFVVVARSRIISRMFVVDLEQLENAQPAVVAVWLQSGQPPAR